MKKMNPAAVKSIHGTPPDRIRRKEKNE